MSRSCMPAMPSGCHSRACPLSGASGGRRTRANSDNAGSCAALNSNCRFTPRHFNTSRTLPVALTRLSSAPTQPLALSADGRRANKVCKLPTVALAETGVCSMSPWNDTATGWSGAAVWARAWRTTMSQWRRAVAMLISVSLMSSADTASQAGNALFAGGAAPALASCTRGRTTAARLYTPSAFFSMRSRAPRTATSASSSLPRSSAHGSSVTTASSTSIADSCVAHGAFG